MVDDKEPLTKEQIYERNRLAFAKLANLTLSDMKKNETRTYQQYTKEDYRSYIQNPKSNEKNLRNMSRFFYIVSSVYRRLCKYYAEIPLLNWVLTPQIDMLDPQDPEKVKKAYQKALKLLTNMNMKHEFRKIMTTVWREDVYYGYIYSTTDSWFIDTLDPDYCKIVQVEDGCYNFAFDFSYYDKFQYKLETADTELQSMYQAYKKDTQNMKWQILNSKKTICIKAGEDSIGEVIPPLVGIFEDLIDLIDYRSLIRNREEIQNYVLLVQKVPVYDKTEGVDNFLLDMDTILDFDARMAENTPDQVGVITSPMDITPLQFKNDAPESDVLSKATRMVFDNAGTSQMLFNSDKSGSLGLDASIKTDEIMSFSIVRQLERWVRRYIKQNTSSIKFNFEFLNVSAFNQNSFVDQQLKLATAGVPNKLTLCASIGADPLQTLSAAYVENTILGLQEQFVPLQTSYTQSNTANEGGRPEKDVSDLGDAGMQTRDGNQNADTIET